MGSCDLGLLWGPSADSSDLQLETGASGRTVLRALGFPQSPKQADGWIPKLQSAQHQPKLHEGCLSVTPSSGVLSMSSRLLNHLCCLLNSLIPVGQASADSFGAEYAMPAMPAVMPQTEGFCLDCEVCLGLAAWPSFGLRASTSVELNGKALHEVAQVAEQNKSRLESRAVKSSLVVGFMCSVCVRTNPSFCLIGGAPPPPPTIRKAGFRNNWTVALH